MRVLVCGDRNWRDRDFIYKELDKLAKEISIDCIIEGDARGADRIAGYWARRNRILNLKFPADWHTLGRKAGPLRNIQMLDEGKPDLVLAFHDDIDNSKGTKHMITIAQERNIPVRLFWH